MMLTNILHALVAVFCLSGLVACQTPSAMSAVGGRSVMVVAHRGCLEDAPENSMKAMQDCAALGVDIVETDIQALAGGTPIIMHDVTLDRTTNAVGPVTALDAGAFASLKLREKNGGAEAALTSHAPPLLAEVLDDRPTGMMLNLDVKDVAIYPSVNRMLRRRSAGPAIILKSSMAPDHPDFDAFTEIGGAHFMPVIRQCKEGGASRPEIYCAWTAADILRDFEGVQVFGYELIFHEEAFLASVAAALADQPVEIWVNVLAEEHAAGHTDELALNDPDAHWGRLVDLGATILQTDYPARLVAYLEGRHARAGRQP